MNTVADSMRGRVADREAAKFHGLGRAGLLKSAQNTKWCGDITEVRAEASHLYTTQQQELQDGPRSRPKNGSKPSARI